MRIGQSKITDTKQPLLDRQHGALGLSALLAAHPYDVPDWMPATLAILASHLRDPSPIDGSLFSFTYVSNDQGIVKETLNEFWRTHQDEWLFFQELFTQDQQDSIRQSTVPSYFA